MLKYLALISMELVAMQNVLESPGIRDAILRLDVDQYHRLCSSGIISERTELLDGVVVEKMGKSPLHTWTVAVLEDWLRNHLRDGLLLRVEQPLTLGNSEPEPDLAVIAGCRDDFQKCHPSSALLVVEVAITTADLDQAKSAVYAHAGIVQYLLVMPEQKQVIVFEDPSETSYTTKRILAAGEPILLSGICDRKLDLSLLFAEQK